MSMRSSLQQQLGQMQLRPAHPVEVRRAANRRTPEQRNNVLPPTKACAVLFDVPVQPRRASRFERRALATSSAPS